MNRHTKQRDAAPWVRSVAFVCVILCFLGANAALRAQETEAVIRPGVLPYAVKNPLAGWRGRRMITPPKGGTRTVFPADADFESLKKWYIGWDEIESRESDGPERIKAVLDALWKDLPARNEKAIPRIVIVNNTGTHVPADLPPMKDRDWNESPWYTDVRVRARIQRLIERLGALLDHDPRVAWVEMGVQGKYGEQWGLTQMPEFAPWLYGMFAKHFTAKKVTVRSVGMPSFGADATVVRRLAGEFPFGFYQDSFGMELYRTELMAIAALDGGTRWRQAVMGGEIRTWKNALMTDSLEGNLCGPALATLIEWTRVGHVSHLGWDRNDFCIQGRGSEGAMAMRRALGAHFVIPEFRYRTRARPGESMPLSVQILNTGSSPFYYDWPVELCLVDEATRQKVAAQRLDGLDLRACLPGSDWDKGRGVYRQAPQILAYQGNFTVPREVKPGAYVACLSILDPEGGMLPCLRFDITNYWQGGLHPMGRVAIGVPDVPVELDPAGFFTDPIDRTLHYVVR